MSHLVHHLKAKCQYNHFVLIRLWKHQKAQTGREHQLQNSVLDGLLVVMFFTDTKHNKL